MEKEKIIARTKEYVKAELIGESSGHDWWHAYRVWQNAIHICEQEKADLFVVELAALLHDIADWKFNEAGDKAGPKVAKEFLKGLGVDSNIIEQVVQIITEMSFKGKNHTYDNLSKESLILQDADRLDAMGAIGIARAFATGAKLNEILHDPNTPPLEYGSAKEYTEAKGKEGRTIVNHFYEKLFLLKDLMNTETGRKIAEGRHKYMKDYLDRFFKEWDGKE